MVYVNTLKLQEVLAQPHCQDGLIETDLRGSDAADVGTLNPYDDSSWI
jgi:hypothetical protein